MRHLVRLWCAVFGSLALVACPSTETVDAPTQIMLRIGSTDDALLRQLTHVRAAVSLHEGDTWKEPVAVTVPKDALRWPVDIPITPRARGDAFKQFEVVVEALADDSVLAQARAVTSFVPNERRVLALWLYTCPGHEASFVCADAGCRGESCTTCTMSGGCAPVGATDPENLQPLAGADAGMDGGEPAPEGPEGGAADEDGRVPDDAADAPVACDLGYVADPQGECVNPDDCPAGACADGSCVDGLDDYSCSCGSGFAGTGTKACTPVVYCPKDACAPGGTCVDQMAWHCQCGSGFTGTGTQACVNVDDCPQGACAPGGVCVDAVDDYSCNCSTAGYAATSNGQGCGLSIGQPCSADSACLSNSCNLAGCQNPVGLNGSCNSSADCMANLSCNGSQCKGDNGYACGSDSDCISGSCPPEQTCRVRGYVSASCDGTNDCQPNDGLVCDPIPQQCRYPRGELDDLCDRDSDCVTGLLCGFAHFLSNPGCQ